MCFYKIVLRGPGYPKISDFGYPVPEITYEMNMVYNIPNLLCVY